MVRNHKRKTEHGSAAPDVMLRAVRSTVKDLNVNYCTVALYCKTLTPEDIRPYAKAGPRKKVSQQRKKREKLLLSPVKEALEA